MSTRSMTIIAQPYAGTIAFVPLYRHCDGYPAEAGKAIVDALSAAPTPTCPEDILARLLSLRYDGHGDVVTGGADPVYRAATWQPEDQGDLEHVYQITPQAVEDTVTPGRIRPDVLSWTIKHYVRNGWAAGSDDYHNWPACVYTLQEFSFLVDREIAKVQRRIAARQPISEGSQRL